MKKPKDRKSIRHDLESYFSLNWQLLFEGQRAFVFREHSPALSERNSLNFDLS